MSKRTPGLIQRPRGWWPTPREAVVPLIPFLPRRLRYGEPCAGDGQLIMHLTDLLPDAVCEWASDVVPQTTGIAPLNVYDIDADTSPNVGMWITNPPWPLIGQKGSPALPIIQHLMRTAPVWALLPWDFAANDYFRQMSKHCVEVVPIGRISWMRNGVTGKDNCGWFHFNALNRNPTAIRVAA